MLNTLEREGAGLLRLARACMYGKEEEVAVNAGRGEAPTTWEKSAIALGPSEHMINERGISSPTKGVVESTDRT